MGRRMLLVSPVCLFCNYKLATTPIIDRCFLCLTRRLGLAVRAGWMDWSVVDHWQAEGICAWRSS